MLKKIFKKFSAEAYVQELPSTKFDGSKTGYILIASPEDVVELIAHPTAIPVPVLKKILSTGIKRLEDEELKNRSAAQNN